MSATGLLRHLETEMAMLTEAGLFKTETVITSPQGPEIATTRRTSINFCANNYLGLANHPALVEAAIAALTTHGYGLASVRFICGTQDLHKQLEGRIAGFLETDAAILYSSCFDANGGMFETILGPDDAIVSDALNHASIIDADLHVHQLPGCPLHRRPPSGARCCHLRGWVLRPRFQVFQRDR